MKQYRIDGTDLTFWAEDYSCACEVVNKIGESLLEWAKNNEIEIPNATWKDKDEYLQEKLIQELLNGMLGFERIDPITGENIAEE